MCLLLGSLWPLKHIRVVDAFANPGAAIRCPHSFMGPSPLSSVVLAMKPTFCELKPGYPSLPLSQAEAEAMGDNLCQLYLNASWNIHTTLNWWRFCNGGGVVVASDAWMASTLIMDT